MTRENPRRLRWRTIALGAIALCASQSAGAQQSPAAQRGLTFVRVHCAQCHAISKVGSLERPLAEGITASHPTMPQFRLDADQIADVIAYLKTLEH